MNGWLGVYQFLLIYLAVNNKKLLWKHSVGIAAQLGSKRTKGGNSSVWMTATWVQDEVPGIQ